MSFEATFFAPVMLEARLVGEEEGSFRVVPAEKSSSDE